MNMPISGRNAAALILFLLLCGCTGRIEPPKAGEFARPEAVAASLDSVDPEVSLDMFDYDREAPLEIVLQREWREGVLLFSDFSYASPKGGRVPARIVIPDDPGPHPAIILQHGAMGNYEQMTGLAREFATCGAAVFMMNDPYTRPGVWNPTEYMGYTWPFFTPQDLEIKVQMIIDLQRAVDLLLLRDDIDPERIAYYGISFGGAMGGLLAGVENRIQAYVLQVGDGGLVEHTSDPGEDGLPDHFSRPWAEMMWPTESIHFVGRAAPAAVLFLNGTQDTMVTPQDALRYQTAASEPKTVLWYDAGHDLPESAYKDSFNWLQDYIGDELYLIGPDFRRSAVAQERLLGAWLAAVVVSMVALLIDSSRMKLQFAGRFMWLLTALWIGPLALATYLFVQRQGVKNQLNANCVDKARRLVGIDVWSMSGFMLGFVIGLLWLIVPGDLDVRIRLLLSYLTSLTIGLLVSWFHRIRLQRTCVAFLLTLNLVWLLGLVLSVEPIIPGIPTGILDLRIVWLIAFNYLLIGIVLLPFHAWLIWERSEAWVDPEVDQIPGGRFASHSRWLLRLTLVSSYVGMVVAIVGLIALSEQVSFVEAGKFFFGFG